MYCHRFQGHRYPIPIRLLNESLIRHSEAVKWLQILLLLSNNSPAFILFSTMLELCLMWICSHNAIQTLLMFFAVLEQICTYQFSVDSESARYELQSTKLASLEFHAGVWVRRFLSQHISGLHASKTWTRTKPLDMSPNSGTDSLSPEHRLLAE